MNENITRLLNIITTYNKMVNMDENLTRVSHKLLIYILCFRILDDDLLANWIGETEELAEGKGKVKTVFFLTSIFNR